MTEFCKKPPGLDDDIDLSVTKELNISAGWTCRWWDYKCEGLTRNYFEELLRQLSPNYLQRLRFVVKCSIKTNPNLLTDRSDQVFSEHPFVIKINWILSQK